MGNIGDKIEPRETHKEALKKEIEEELNVTIDEHFMTIKHQFIIFHLTMNSYIIRKYTSQIELNVHKEYK